MMVAFSSVPIFDVRLSAADDLTLRVSIRDYLDCITEYNLSSVIVKPDSIAINNFIDSIGKVSENLTNNSIVRLLASENQNIVSQTIISLSNEFNQIYNQTLYDVVSGKHLE